MEKVYKPSELDAIPFPERVSIRLNQMRFTMEDHKVEAIVVSHLSNVRYMTNFSGSSALLFITRDKVHFVTDERYKEHIIGEIYGLPDMEIHITRTPWEHMVTAGALKGVQALGFEADKMPYADAVEIRNKIRPVKFKPVTKMVTRFMQPKAPEELEHIKASLDLADKTYQKMLEIIKPGVSEKDIATEISYQARLLGSEGEPSDIIVISGPRGSIVNGNPTDRKIKKNELIIIDYGCRVNGFGTDISRTISTGKVTKEQKKIYDLLKDARKAAIDGVRPGMHGKHLDSLAREVINKAGYGDQFQHNLGHGFGLASIEEPIVTFRLEEEMIPEDSVLAIEPGVYIDEKFGIRAEEPILVTKNGGEVLLPAPDEIAVV